MCLFGFWLGVGLGLEVGLFAGSDSRWVFYFWVLYLFDVGFRFMSCGLGGFGVCDYVVSVVFFLRFVM